MFAKPTTIDVFIDNQVVGTRLLTNNSWQKLIQPNFLYQPSWFLLRSYRHMHNLICQIYRLFIYGECSWVQCMLWFFPNSELMLWLLMSTDVFWPIWAWAYQNKTVVSSLYGQFVLKSTHFFDYIWINIAVFVLKI